MNYTETLAKWASGVIAGDIDKAVMDKAAELLLDWAGCAFGGSNQEQALMLEGIVKENSPVNGPSCLLNGRMGTTSALWAAFQNGFNGHILEMDDVHRVAVMHPGTVVIPAALAIGQQLHVSGRQLLAAICIGYEVGIRVGIAAGATHYHKWHTTGTCATFGAAAAAGYLLALDAEQMAWALGNAGSQAAGLWQFLQDGAMTKPLHAGKAAFNGLLAALAAKNGFTGPSSILEGSKGFLSATSTNVELSKLTENLGWKWQLADVSVKPYPSCRHSHPQIDIAIDVFNKKGFCSKEVASITIGTYQTAIDVAGSLRHYPKTSNEAKFDSLYCAAQALVKGTVIMSDFEEANLEASDVKHLRQKMVLQADDRYNSSYPAKWGASIDAILNDGSTFHSETLYAKGDPEKPVGREELISKFVDLAVNVLPEERLHKLAAGIFAIDKVKDIDSMFNK